MMTLIARLCALCAVSALLQMAVPQGRARGGLRLLCGLLMMELTLRGGSDVLARIAAGGDLGRIFERLLQ